MLKRFRHTKMCRRHKHRQRALSLSGRRPASRRAGAARLGRAALQNQLLELQGR